MDKVVTEFLEEEDIKLWIWLRYIDHIFFIWTQGKNKLFTEIFTTFEHFPPESKIYT